ncbi:hypothetical protein [Naasia lichenicola]|uniref:Uncharacterized protein n=1 Tax=Naasia lichenicola TaxID=2565933 RepID=A0A4S4FLD3_9MICO|nr:hypothetical protein [Naasia lichenicola]THG30991.1 hypothetical protein E6C64_10320 [Naasia lichenicola]
MAEESDDLGRRAVTLFAATSLVAAIVVGAMLVSGYRAGVLDNRIEWLYWAGAILGAAGVACLGIASMPARPSEASVGRLSALIRTGLLLFMAAPVLCVIAVFTDYWI